MTRLQRKANLHLGLSKAVKGCLCTSCKLIRKVEAPQVPKSSIEVAVNCNSQALEDAIKKARLLRDLLHESSISINQIRQKFK